MRPLFSFTFVLKHICNTNSRASVQFTVDVLRVTVVDKSCEIKRATIIGNPMFSAAVGGVGSCAVGPSGGGGTPHMAASQVGVTPMDMPPLDDLQLDMDYDQIMNYFDSLKVGKLSTYAACTWFLPGFHHFIF